MRMRFLAFLFLAFCPLLIAQQALDNDAVIKLTKAGLSEDLIVSTINSQGGTYDTSTNGLIALKSAGVSDKVVAALVAKAAAPIPPLPPMPAVTQQATTDPDDPASPHEAGIYIFSDKAPRGSKMVMLEPSIYTQGKMGGVFTSAMTYGIAKVKTKAVLRGARSNAQISDSEPVFYFYFETQGAGLSHASMSFGGTSTPNEYTLLKFEVKGDTRETVVGKFNAYGGSGGTDDKAIINFTYAKLGPGVYKVTLSAPLKHGEYGFISGSGFVGAGPYVAAATSGSRVFDFGLN
ncbi:MAG: hypothetical protein ABSE46_24670 [Terracidiphilus sp.]|jgi:hypothetical protein